MKPIINFFLPIFKIFGYLILTVIVYTTIEGLYSEQETNTSKQMEVKEAHHESNDNDLENEAVQLL
ncbi:MAG: hypothetical protein ACPGVB_07680 [Chitinophagales bacterium]